VSSSTDALSVNGTGYAEDDFNKLSEALVSAGQFTATNGKIKTEDANVILRTLIRYEAFLQFIKENDVKILDADKAEVLKSANADEKFPTYPKELQDVLVNFNLADVTLRKMAPPAIDKIEKLYSDSPASAGVLCLSHILVKTEAEANEVLADLKAGTKFAAEAAKKSIEPGADKSGGSLGSGDQPCQPLATLQTSFDKDFMIGAVAAKPGIATGPVKSSFGYHVILSAPFADVKDSVATVVAENPGPTLLAGFMSTADIKVSSTYGVWNGATATIS
jgi:parvulin-like peptidyl-prolyl isomerase